MGDGYCCPAFGSTVKCVLDNAFGVGVEGGGRLIQ